MARAPDAPEAAPPARGAPRRSAAGWRKCRWRGASRRRSRPPAFPRLRATGIEVLQINVGRKCNQTCRHCHVDAGPDRTEIMPEDVVDACLRVLAAVRHPDARHHRRRARAAPGVPLDRRDGRRARPPRDRPLQPHHHPAAQLPLDRPRSSPSTGSRSSRRCRTTRRRQTDAQRGEGVFEESIEALRELNALGYGVPGTGLALNLVTNPVGAFLPPDQRAAERDWKRELERRHGDRLRPAVHHHQHADQPLPRVPGGRRADGRVHGHAGRALQPGGRGRASCAGPRSRSAGTAPCTTATSTRCSICRWREELPRDIRDFDPAALARRAIAVGPHCFGCTAGAGSSCGGAVA